MSRGGKILNRGREKKRKILNKTEGRKKIKWKLKFKRVK
jgi:hypothetical protein